MRRSTFKNIEAILRDYPDYDKYIAEREQSLLYPDNIYSDENIGGGRSNQTSDPTGRKAVTLAEDRTLLLLKYQKEKIEKVIDESDFVTNKVVAEYYFARPQLKTWDGVAVDNGMSKTNCLRIRDRFFDMIADELGLLK